MSDSYETELPGIAGSIRAERLRWERHELFGELTVRCGLPGARTVNGCLSKADFNFSSIRSRQDRAKHLAQRANTNGKVDWYAVMEDFSQHVLEAERMGEPAVDLSQLPRPEREDEIRIDGLVLPRRHPTIYFGDGGSAKSYTALYVAGRLSQMGIAVALFDWELCKEDHRDRLERLFGPSMPRVIYRRCMRPLTAEADYLVHVVQEHQIEFAIYDSVAVACDGRPEDAEVAARYFRTVREIGAGSVHIAHVTKSEENDKRPFGSAFWHNCARSTWFVQGVESDGVLRVGFFNRKSNLGPLLPPVAFKVTFTKTSTEFRPIDVADTPDLALRTSVRTRMHHFLRTGAQTVSAIALAIDAKSETIEREIRRHQDEFIVFGNGLVGLKGKL